MYEICVFLPLLPLLHHQNLSGERGSQFCHFYQQKIRKKSETVGEVAKLSLKKVAPWFISLRVLAQMSWNALYSFMRNS